MPADRDVAAGRALEVSAASMGGPVQAAGAPRPAGGWAGAVPPGLQFLTLGELVVRAGGRNLPLPGRNVRALLGALLLTPGDVVGDERLLDLVWEAGTGSRRALQCAASRLRAWLREHTGTRCRLEHAGSGYQLVVPPGSVDISRFRELVHASSAAKDPERRLVLLSAALSEWRGPVLGGRLELLSADPVVRAVEQARVDCALALADAAAQLGRPAEAVMLVAAVATSAPYDEPLQARLVRLLTACGRHAEALRWVERIRRRLADELGVTPSGEVTSAHAEILQGYHHAPPRPAQLPADLPDFTGRQRETAALTELVLAEPSRAGLVGLIVVSGPAGAGKSALAVHVAHQTAARFVDGQLYADLGAAGARLPDPADVLGRFLRALGVAAPAVPDTLEERAGLYRSMTAGRKLLLLLDNAVAEEQVRPLLPGSPGCVALVTSRTCLTGLAGAHLVGLGALPPGEAVRLLERTCGRAGVARDPAAAEVTRHCDQLPLAIRIAGARLAARPRLRLGRLAASLRDQDRRLDELAAHGMSVRASLSAGYRELAPERRRALRLLGLFRAPDVSAWAAAALLDVPAGEAAALLEALVDAGLLDMLGEDQAGQVRYGLADLVRLYARERALAEDPPASRDAALRRVLGTLLHLTEQASRRACGRTPDHARPPARCHALPAPTPGHPLAWLDAEAATLRAAVDQAWEHGLDDLAVALACAAADFYATRQRHDDWRHTHQVALQAASRRHDQSGRAVLLRNLARLDGG